MTASRRGAQDEVASTSRPVIGRPGGDAQVANAKGGTSVAAAMVQTDFMTATVHEAVPDADVHATDLTGGGDHWHCVVVSPAFEGQRPLQRQRAVLAAFKPAIDDGRVHALDLKCLTPQELEDRFGGKAPAPFVPHQAGEGAHPGAWR